MGNENGFVLAEVCSNVCFISSKFSDMLQISFAQYTVAII
jgi:hypothetical protein